MRDPRSLRRDAIFMILSTYSFCMCASMAEDVDLFMHKYTQVDRNKKALFRLGPNLSLERFNDLVEVKVVHDVVFELKHHIDTLDNDLTT